MPGKGNALGQRGEGHRIGRDEGAHQGGNGRSDSSPGHLKREAGEQSARDFAPGRTGRSGRGPSLPEGAPEEMGED